MTTNPSGPTTVRWRVLALIVIGGFVAYFLRSNMSVAGEAMMRDLSLTKTQLGFVLAAFAWGYAAFQFPSGVLGDKIGARRIIALAAIAWGVLNLLVGLMPSSGFLSITGTLAALVTLRALMGVAQAPFFPVTGGSMICSWFPPKGWALPQGLSNVGLTFGAAATPPIIAWLVQQYGWRASYVITAPLGLVFALIWWWYVRDTPHDHPGVGVEEQALIDAERPAFATGHAESGAWKRVLRDRDLRMLTLSYLCSNFLFYFFFNWLYIYLVENRGMKLLESGFYAAAPWVTGAGGALVGGIACDRLAARFGMRWGYRAPGMVGLVLAAVFILAAAGVSNPIVAVVLLSLCLASQQTTEAAFWTATIALSGKDAAAASGILNTGGNVAGGFGAILVPLVVERFGWAAALGSAACFSLAGAALWMLVDPNRELAKESGHATSVP